MRITFDGLALSPAGVAITVVAQCSRVEADVTPGLTMLNCKQTFLLCRLHWNLEILVLGVGAKPDNPEEKKRSQSKAKTNNKLYPQYGTRSESNP